jgi:hypothetical protein
VFNLTVAISLFQSAEMYIELGKFGIPARHHEAIALIYAKVRENKSGMSEIEIKSKVHLQTACI